MDPLNKHINDLTEEDWIELYHKRGMSLPQLAKHYGVTPKPITDRMGSFGIERRGFGPKVSLIIPRDLLEDLYLKQNLSAARIAKKLSCSDKTVRDKIVEYGIKKPRPVDVLTQGYLNTHMSAGKTARDISQESGFSVPVIYKFLHKYGFEVGESAKKPSREFEDLVVGMYSEGRTTTDIASALDSTPTRILNVLNRQKQVVREANDYHRKLPNPEELDTLYRAGSSIGQIAKEYNVEVYAVLYWLEKQGTPLRNKSESTLGDKNHMKGTNHTDATREKMAKAYLNDMRDAPSGSRGNPTPLDTPNQGTVMTKSTWEAAVGRYLNSIGADYYYEPDKLKITVDKRVCSYTPDFKVVVKDNSVPQERGEYSGQYYIEVKGYMEEISEKKIDAARVEGYDIKLWDLEKLKELGVLDRSNRVII